MDDIADDTERDPDPVPIPSQENDSSVILKGEECCNENESSVHALDA